MTLLLYSDKPSDPHCWDDPPQLHRRCVSFDTGNVIENSPQEVRPRVKRFKGENPLISNNKLLNTNCSQLNFIKHKVCYQMHI